MPTPIKAVAIAVVSGAAYTSAFYGTSIALRPVVRAIINS